CSKFHSHNIAARVMPHTSSIAPHLINASISSRSTGTRARKSASETNLPCSSRSRTIATIFSTRSPFTCIKPTRSAARPLASRSAAPRPSPALPPPHPHRVSPTTHPPKHQPTPPPPPPPPPHPPPCCSSSHNSCQTKSRNTGPPPP